MPLPRPVLPMSIDEFKHMEHRLGWKHEYWNGAAQLSTQESALTSFQRAIAPIATPVRLAADEQLRIVRPDDEPALIELFITAFDEAVEYAGWPDDIYRRDAEESVGAFFGKPGRHGHRDSNPARPDASFVIATPAELRAAVLVRSIRRGPILEPIMVHPAHQRRSLATAVLIAAVNALHSVGDSILYSRCQLGNAASLAWHEQNGFQEIPNYFAANHRCHHFVWLAEHFDDIQQPDKAAEMRKLAEHWEAVVQKFEDSPERWSSGLLD